MVNRYTITNISFISKTFKINDEKIQSIYNAYPTKKLPIAITAETISLNALLISFKGPKFSLNTFVENVSLVFLCFVFVCIICLFCI